MVVVKEQNGGVKEKKGGGSSLGFHHSGRYVATQSRLIWVPGDPKSAEIFIFYSFGNRYKRDRNGPQMVQKAPKPHFWVILTHFGMALVGLLGIIIRIKAPQMGPIWAQIGFSKCLLRHVNAGKGHFWSQKCTLPLVTQKWSLPYLWHRLFFFCSDGVGGGFPAQYLLWRLLVCVHCRLTATAAGSCCSAHFNGLSDYAIAYCYDCRVRRDRRKHPHGYYYYTFYPYYISCSSLLACTPPR